MATPTKPARLWVYLNEEDQERLNALKRAVRTLGDVEILSTIVASGLLAIEQHGTRMPLPLNFKIDDGDPMLNEPSPPYGKKK